MEVPRNAFRAMIFYDYKRGLTYDQSHQNLMAAFDDNSPSLSTISYWFREFKRGRSTLEDEPRPGRPAVAVCAENIIATEKLIKEKRNITHREIQDELGIGIQKFAFLKSSRNCVVIAQDLVCVEFCYTTITQLHTRPQKL